MTQHLSFLNNLINGYISAEKAILNKDSSNQKVDNRIFEPHGWKFEPKLILISKVGNVDAPGVDTLFKNLGFKHAETTIPKWTQRGLMDNANELIEKLIEIYMKLHIDV